MKNKILRTWCFIGCLTVLAVRVTLADTSVNFSRTKGSLYAELACLDALKGVAGGKTSTLSTVEWDMKRENYGARVMTYELDGKLGLLVFTPRNIKFFPVTTPRQYTAGAPRIGPLPTPDKRVTIDFELNQKQDGVAESQNFSMTVIVPKPKGSFWSKPTVMPANNKERLKAIKTTPQDMLNTSARDFLTKEVAELTERVLPNLERTLKKKKHPKPSENVKNVSNISDRMTTDPEKIKKVIAEHKNALDECQKVNGLSDKAAADLAEINRLVPTNYYIKETQAIQ